MATTRLLRRGNQGLECVHEPMMAAVASEPRTHTLSVEQVTGVYEVINVVATTDADLYTALLAELRFYVRRCSTDRS